MVVDDEAAQRFLLRRCFETAGHDVFEAGDGAVALRSVRDARPDLVVTDVMMPVMDGLELITRLRAEATTADIPILVVSDDRTLESAANAVVAKPYDAKELITVAEGLLDNGCGRT